MAFPQPGGCTSAAMKRSTLFATQVVLVFPEPGNANERRQGLALACSTVGGNQPLDESAAQALDTLISGFLCRMRLSQCISESFAHGSLTGGCSCKPFPWTGLSRRF